MVYLCVIGRGVSVLVASLFYSDTHPCTLITGNIQSSSQYVILHTQSTGVVSTHLWLVALAVKQYIQLEETKPVYFSFPVDIVFFIFLYQRWIYRVDPRRVNEFGTSGDSPVDKPKQDPLEAGSSGVEGGKEADKEPIAGPQEGDREGGGAVRKRTTAARS